MNPGLLSTKLRMPSPSKKYLKRSRLTNQLQEIPYKKMTIIQGIAGSGKSLLLSDFLLHNQLSKQTSWVNLSANCNDITLFWSYVLEGLKPFLKDSAHYTSLQHQFPKEAYYEFLVVLINHLIDTPIYLVLDDFQVLTDPLLLESIEFFYQNSASNVHFIFLSRKDLPYYLGKLKIENNLLQLTNQDLALTESEAQQFIDIYQKFTLSKEQRAEYIVFSEGWIGGLQLLLTEKNNPKEKALPLNLNNKSRVYEYLKEEIFKNLKSEIKDFLLTTVQFSYFNQKICTQLFPKLNYQHLLKELENNHIMLQKIDEESKAYRYHHLFEDFLRKQSAILSQEKRRAIKIQGATFFQEEDDLEEAINLLTEIECYQKAMSLIMQLEQPMRRFYFMKKVPNHIMIDNFDFTFQKFFFYYANLEEQPCLEIYQLAIEQSKKDARFELFKGIEFVLSTRQENIMLPVLKTEYIDSLSLTPTTKILLMIRNLSLLFYQSRYQEGLKQVKLNQSFIAQIESTDTEYLQFANQNIHAQLLEETGNFTQALEVYKNISRMIENAQSLNELSNFFYLSYHVSVLGIFLKQMDFESAQNSFDIIESVKSSDSYKVAVLYNQVEYWYLTEQKEKGLAGVQQLVNEPIYQTLLPLARLLKFPLTQGQLSQKLKDKFSHSFLESPYKSYDSQLFYSMLLVEGGKKNKAEAWIDDLLKKARKEKISLKIVEGNLLKIQLIISNSSRHKEAQDLYREAIYYACDEKMLQPFFLAKATLTQLFIDNYQQLLDSLTGVELAFHEKLVNEWQLVTRHSLTSREVEVLNEMAKGFTNNQIAQSLFISQATVKTHILSIYRKLQVTSRVTAIEKGKKLDVLN